MEKLQKLIKDKKVLESPLYEGDTEIREEKHLATRNQPVGYAQVGFSQGLTFSEDDQSRSSTWHRIDTWIVVYARPSDVEEVQDVLSDIVVDRLADKYEAIMDFED